MGLGISTASALNALATSQTALAQASNQASSGKRLTNASIDPSGVAIYNALTQQAAGDDTANQNIDQAGDAIAVAQGAAGGIQSALQQLQGLAIQAGNGFNSPGDNAALQAQANQLLAQIDTDASTVNFNGTPLLTGQNSGTTPATAAQATTTNDDSTGSGSSVITAATATAATASGTIGVAVTSTGAAAVANVTFTDSASQTTTNVGQFAAGSTATVAGTTVTFGQFTIADAGESATVQTTAAAPGATNPAITIQSGANAGQTTTVTLPNATTAGLGITNIDFSTEAAATDSLGQITAALQKLGSAQAQLGAQSVSLGNAFDNNAVASVNLTASASDIGDTQVASIATELNSLRTQQQISIATINNANVANGYLNRFFSVSA
jgi:flagellin